MATDPENTNTSPLDEILRQYMVRIDRGEQVDRDEFIAQHPEVSEELREYFADADALEKMTFPLDGMDTLPHQGQQSIKSNRGSRDFGDYELLEEVARGGMGVVYKAKQRSLNRIVAVKTILAGQLATKDQVDRFRHEAETAANLKHPHIVAIHEVNEHAGLHYFSMDYIDGESLAELVHENSLPSHTAADYLRKVAVAVQYAHEHGTLHRDIKPSNIIIDSDNEPHVTDFGLARPLERDSDLTAQGAIIGSPSYMAPEQAEGRNTAVGPASDVYSLGGTLYDLLTGRPPFQADTVSATLLQVIHDYPAAPRLLNPSIDRDLETICLKCLEKDPADRYESAAALADDLGRFLDRKPIRARPPHLFGRLVRWSKREPHLAALTALTALAMIVGTAISSYFAILSSERADWMAVKLRETESLKLSVDSRSPCEES